MLDIAVSTALPVVSVTEGVLLVHGVPGVTSDSWTAGMLVVAFADRVIDGAAVVFRVTPVAVAAAGAEILTLFAAIDTT